VLGRGCRTPRVSSAARRSPAPKNGPYARYAAKRKTGSSSPPAVRPSPADAVAQLAAAVEPRYRAAVVLLAGSGLRIGELCGLRVADVDWLRRVVRVERQRLPGGELGPVKTATSARTVPLGAVVLDELAAHLAAHPSGEWLFTRPDGAPLDYRTWLRVWTRARRATGLDVHTHDLRHLYASALIADGASVKVVQQRLGHASAAVTLDMYAGAVARRRRAVAHRSGSSHPRAADWWRTRRGGERRNCRSQHDRRVIRYSW
jgi:integrase